MIDVIQKTDKVERRDSDNTIFNSSTRRGFSKYSMNTLAVDLSGDNASYNVIAKTSDVAESSNIVAKKDKV